MMRPPSAPLLNRRHILRASVLSRLVRSSCAFLAFADCTCLSTASSCSAVSRSPRRKGPSVFIMSN